MLFGQGLRLDVRHEFPGKELPCRSQRGCPVSFAGLVLAGRRGRFGGLFEVVSEGDLQIVKLRCLLKAEAR